MSRLQAALLHHFSHGKGRPAWRCGDEMLDWQSLGRRSLVLSRHLRLQDPGRGPVLVFGHKQALMPVCMLGCLFSGRPWVLVDSCTPLLRLEQIAALSGASLLLAAEPLSESACLPQHLDRQQIEQICTEGPPSWAPTAVQPQDICYILFTSGSTGAPRGVRITHGNLDSFLGWATSLPAVAAVMPGTTLGQSLYSFDLSVADLFLPLFTGGCSVTLTRETQGDFPRLFAQLRQSGATLAVMTPSFADYLLLDRSFSSGLMPALQTVFLCGEVLRPATAHRLLQRFPGLHILNAWGPTEATVAVSAVELTPGLLQGDAPLPIGTGHCNGSVLSADASGAPLPDGTPGELIITGPAVGAGYLDGDGGRYCTHAGTPAFRTRDLGRWQDGLLYFHGRMDGQLKRGGYRIEPADIENSLSALHGVAACAVVPQQTGAKLLLHAFVQPVPGSGLTAELLRRQLSGHLPFYLMPDRYHLVEHIPRNHNGKCDRGTLLAELSTDRS